jgi:hypothetical protein
VRAAVPWGVPLRGFKPSRSSVDQLESGQVGTKWVQSWLPMATTNRRYGERDNGCEAAAYRGGHDGKPIDTTTERPRSSHRISSRHRHVAEQK